MVNPQVIMLSESNNGEAVVTIIRTMVPPNVHVLIPRTCKFVTSHGRRHFADVNELRTLKCGNDPGIFE